MLKALAAEHDAVRVTFDAASRALGFDLWALAQEGPEERLNETANTQPMLLTAGVAVWRVWRAAGGAEPASMAGHSLGEYSALVCAQALEFDEAVRLVADRGRYMQEAVPKGQGAMAAILGLAEEAVRELCARAAEGEVLAPVNYNSPEQVVIAGSAAAVKRALAQAQQAGAKRALALPVSGPFHCSLMAPAARRMAERLRAVQFRPPRVPVLHNAHLQAEREPQGIRDALVRQIESPVRWVDTVRKMIAGGVDTFVECGPGKVLAGLHRRIAPQVPMHPVFDPPSLQQALAAVAK